MHPVSPCSWPPYASCEPLQLAAEGTPVLSVVIGDDTDKYFVGLHTHASFESVPIRSAEAAEAGV